jgi:pimeloyl-ACP methyl ester carboxylesterase
MLHPPSVVFLPGAGGSPAFWEPVADRLPVGWERTLLGWPGAGEQPHDPRINSFEDLVELTRTRIADRCDLIAQSMGGVIALGLALRYPEKLRRLVLVATSGGIDVDALGAADWRAGYLAEFPNAAAWITDQKVEYTTQLARVRAPTLLLWGERDPISPVAVGDRLASLLPTSRLTVMRGGTHAVAAEQPDAVAEAIVEHLS